MSEVNVDADGKRLKSLNRKLKRWIEEEKENEETEFFEELIELREYVIPALRLYHRLRRQAFVRVSEENELFEMTEVAVKKYNEFVMEHSIPPATNEFIPFDEL